MRKLEKVQISELRKEMSILDTKDLLSIVGGDKYYFDQQGFLIRHDESIEEVVIIGSQQMILGGSLEGLEIGNGSGVTFSGSGVSVDLFKFFADNTTVEWAYAYDSEQAGGLMRTSNMPNEVNLNSGDWGKYAHFVHNHGQSNNGMTQKDLEEYNSLPSKADIAYLKEIEKQSGAIYNEITGQWQSYDENSYTQEDWLIDYKDDYQFEH